MIDKVFVVFEYDGYEYTRVRKAFAYHNDAINYRDMLTDTDDGAFFSYFIKEVPVHYALDPKDFMEKDK